VSLTSILLADLERQYHFGGRSDVKPTAGRLVVELQNPRFLPVILQRLAHHLYERKIVFLARLLSSLNLVLFGIEIGMRCEIGPGLYLPHTVGTVIGALRIGNHAVIYHQVTIGAKEMDIGYHEEKRPVIGDHVIIGSGAKVLGGITIGHNVTIGANAVVTHSVPDNVVVGGIPARILKEKSTVSQN
jgi:serine O-acetyltransferase